MPLSHRRQTVDLESIEAVISDVKASRCFGKSSRQLKLFEYLLTRSVSGKSSEITQYSVALDVLDRPESFDPTTDSIVRVELHRLRANLKVYNNSTGAGYHITVPPSSFDIVIEPRRQSLLSKWSLKSWPIVGALVLGAAAIGYGFSALQPSASQFSASCSALKPNLKITYYGDSSDAQEYIGSVLRSTLSQHTGLNILEATQDCRAEAAPLFDVQYTIIQQESLFNLAIKVLNVEKNEIVESRHIVGTIDDTQKDTALYYKLVETANGLAMPSGTLARYAARGRWSLPEAQASYACLVAMYDSYAGEIDQEFETIHECLETSVQSGFAPLDNVGALASSYLDQYRNQRRSNESDPLAAAKALFEAHGDGWIESNEFAIAKIYYEADRPEFNAERMEFVLAASEAKFNTNPQVLFMIAANYGYALGQWDKAKALSDYAKRIYDIRDQSIFEIDASHAIVTQASGAAFEHCYKFYSESSVFVNIIVNACARLDENDAWLKVTEDNLARSGMSEFSDRIGYMDKHVHDPVFMTRLKTILADDSGD